MKKKDIKICPSILAGDFAHLADEAVRVAASGADWLHVDVMDGHFVPNLTIGPQVVAAINRSTDLFLDVHLMIYNPFDYVEAFVSAGADMLTFHFEATEDVEDVLRYIRRCNCRAGLAFRPETSSEFVTKYLPLADMILLMTVPPGFGGQPFMPEVLEKIRFTRMACDTLKTDVRIEVDGGITSETAAACAEAGADTFVSGTYFFSGGDMKERVDEMRRACVACYDGK